MVISFGTWCVEIREHFLENVLWAVICLLGIIWSIKNGNQALGITIFILSQIIYF